MSFTRKDVYRFWREAEKNADENFPMIDKVLINVGICQKNNDIFYEENVKVGRCIEIEELHFRSQAITPN